MTAKPHHYELSKDRLARLLLEAEKAHTEYEKGLGRRDTAWPQWYAAFILKQLQSESRKPSL
jgi:hypothetical protein